jgi:PAS domain S-box-containing protein
MEPATILVVEDEGLVARDLQSRLISMGYACPAVSTTGADALQKASQFSPDLALMDIRLKGEMDGVEVAEQMRDMFDIPCVYLTAYTDDETLRRASITEPYGYLVKPFEEGELHTAIELALYRRKLERKIKQKEQWLVAVMSRIEDAIVIVSQVGLVVFMNPAAERLTGWTDNDAACNDARTVLRVAGQDGVPAGIDPATEVLAQAVPSAVERQFSLVTRDHREVLVECSAVPIIDERKTLSGVALVLRESGNAPQAEEENLGQPSAGKL